VTEETKHNSKYLFLGKHLKLNGLVFGGGGQSCTRTQVHTYCRNSRIKKKEEKKKTEDHRETPLFFAYILFCVYTRGCLSVEGLKREASTAGSCEEDLQLSLQSGGFSYYSCQGDVSHLGTSSR
jgi:hypothetical protein